MVAYTVPDPDDVDDWSFASEKYFSEQVQKHRISPFRSVTQLIEPTHPNLPKDRQLNISDADFKILSRFASVSRTIDNTLHCLESALMGEPPDKDRLHIAIEELEMLRKPLDHLNGDAKTLSFCENNPEAQAVKDEMARRQEEPKSNLMTAEQVKRYKIRKAMIREILTTLQSDDPRFEWWRSLEQVDDEKTYVGIIRDKELVAAVRQELVVLLRGQLPPVELKASR